MRLSIVQPRAYKGENERKNLEMAASYVEKAAKEKAEVVTFPECYPGPFLGPLNFDPKEGMSKLAEEFGVYIGFGAAVEVKGKFFDSYFLVSPEGKVLGDYQKTIISSVDKDLFGKEFTRGRKYDVFKTKVGNIGFSMCWEAYFPEIARALALRGADLIFYPTGNPQYDFRETWKIMLWARSIENLAYVASSANIYKDERGFAYIMSPERIILENFKVGVFTADLDVNKLKKLRSEIEELGHPNSYYKTMPGLLQFSKLWPASYDR